MLMFLLLEIYVIFAYTTIVECADVREARFSLLTQIVTKPDHFTCLRKKSVFAFYRYFLIDL